MYDLRIIGNMNKIYKKLIYSTGPTLRTLALLCLFRNFQTTQFNSI